MVAAGHNNAVIATRLGLAHKTVRNHISNTLTKLQVSDQAQAIIRARRAGLS
jgi:DNA-binding NarL/FixJ family response regulator